MPSRSVLQSWGWGLGLGTVGGAAFFLLDLPLPWMLGAMTATTLATLSRGQRKGRLPHPAIPAPLRAVMLAVLGVMLGAAFTPDLIRRAGHWNISLAALAAGTALSTALVLAYLRRVGRMDAVTAYFAAAPGGVNEMVVTGAALGGDERAIALSHVLRILLIVFLVPVSFRLFADLHRQPLADSLGRLAELSLADGLFLGGCALIGALAARLVRLPAPGLLGPMLASAAVHLLGLTAVRPPAELVIAAQVVSGAAVGCRFRGLSWRAVAAMARVATGSTVLMLAMAAAMAAGLASSGSAAPSSFALLLLAFVPGGIAEMCLIALAMGQDVAFVSTHHVLRVLLVIVLAPLGFRAWRKLSPVAARPDADHESAPDSPVRCPPSEPRAGSGNP